MRREGRQHGMVLCFETHPELSTGSRKVNEFKTVPTTNFMTKVSSKPTNHSRFTSKCCGAPRCVGCHDRPVSKARTKAKKTHKQHKYDVTVNQLLVSQRLVGPGCGSRWVTLDGQSASGLLDLLTSRFYDHDEFDNESYEISHDCSDASSMLEEEDGACVVGLLGLAKEEEQETDMGFCFVDFGKELAEDDGWCLLDGTG